MVKDGHEVEEEDDDSRRSGEAAQDHQRFNEPQSGLPSRVGVEPSSLAPEPCGHPDH